MTDIKEPINTTSDGTFLSVVCENPEKSVVGKNLGATAPPAPPPQELPPALQLKMEGQFKLKESNYNTRYRQQQDSETRNTKGRTDD